MNKFSDLPLAPPIQQALQKVGYDKPTPIQRETIPLVLKGHDILGIAQTGTGKTAAFCLPILDILLYKKIENIPRCPRVLILTPTRELAIQIHENLEQYGCNLKQQYSVIFGGVKQGKQVKDLQRGPHVLVATPGRLLDLIEQRFLNLNKVDIFVLDEADRMLDMGFMRDIKKILPMLPPKRHNLFFSATMPSEIQTLANTILVEPKKVEVTPQSTTVKIIQQSAMYVEKKDKIDLLIHLLKDPKLKKVLVFVQMKHIANRITEKLLKSGYSAAAIHGNKSQPARQKAIQDFTQNRVRVLVATDIASRGIDIDGITHVINYELSNIMESYVHRIGRTARAGSEGNAISLVTGEEKSFLVGIEKTTSQKIHIDMNHPYHSDEAANAEITSVGKAKASLEAQRKSQRSHNRNTPGSGGGSRNRFQNRRR
ncbi:MAG: DEAD/DEAH box helicase [Leptospirales bacterium]